MKTKVLILLMAPLMIGAIASCKKKGCPDETATNFSEKAKKDDGTCTYVPTIQVIGASDTTIYVGTTYNDPGATAQNADGSSVTVQVVSNDVNTSATGTYSVNYTATNSHGSSTAKRTVTVAIGANNWTGPWTVSSTCSGTQFPLNDSPNIILGAQGNTLVIENMFDYLGIIFGTANATIDGETITIPSQNYNNNGVNITFSGTGTLNAQGTIAIVNYTYDNATPLIGGTGTCTATYLK